MYHTQSTTYNKAAAYTGTIGTAAHAPGSTPRRPLLPYKCVIYVYINYTCIIHNLLVTTKRRLTRALLAPLRTTPLYMHDICVH